MTVYIGQYSCDENGRYVGGQAGNLTWTGNIIERFRVTGLVEIYDANYAANSANLRNGDILVSSTHAVVVVSGAKEPGASGDTTSGSAASSFADVDELARAVIARRYGNGDARRAALGDEYAAVQTRVNERCITELPTPLERLLALRGSSLVFIRSKQIV